MRSFYGMTVKERNGVLLLIILICLLQAGIFYLKSYSDTNYELNDDHLALIHEIDSLKQEKQREKQFVLRPFNPNYISDYKGYTLGMSNESIDKLQKYREQGLWVNSAKEFQKVSGVSDELLEKISPYFKFPEWVNQKNSTGRNTNYIKRELSDVEKIDLNLATVDQLKEVYGIGETLANRIVRYRQKFRGGFLTESELNLIYGLSDEVIERISNRFKLKTPRQIETFDLNLATRDDLVKIPFVDYELAFEIIQRRTLHESYKTLDELLKVKGFPEDKFDIIKLYLFLL